MSSSFTASTRPSRIATALLFLTAAPLAATQRSHYDAGPFSPAWPRTLAEAALLPGRPADSACDGTDERDPLRNENSGPALGLMPPAPERPAPDVRSLRASLAAESETLHFDAPGDGALWIRGRTYKARLDGESLTYIPYLGSQAPKNFPVTLELRSATLGEEELALSDDAEPVREGTRVVVARGAVDEIYDFGPDGVEQSFLVRRATREGELVLEIAVESELPMREVDGEGRFENELGGVNYSRAFTYDEDGGELATESSFAGDLIALRVPASDVERARGDLLVDPVLSTGFVMSSPFLDDRNPVVAYDATTDRYLVAFEEVFSQSDYDVRVAILAGSNLAPLTNGFVDFTNEDWRQVSTANLNAADQFLVAAGVANTAPKSIRGRTVAPTTTQILTMSPQFTISNTSVNLNAYHPVVGGDSFPFAPSFYCVAWALNFGSPANMSMGQFALVTPQGTALGAQSFTPLLSWFRTEPSFGFWFDATLTDEVPLAISKSNGGNEWTLAWGSGQASWPSRVSSARIRWNGVVVAPETVIASFTQPDLVVVRATISVSSPSSTGLTLVAWDDVSPAFGGGFTPSRIRAKWLDPATNTSSAIHTFGNLDVPNFAPSVDSQGSRFALSFQQTGTGLPTYRILQLARSGNFLVSMDQASASPSFPNIGRPDMCSEHAAGGTRLNCLMGGTTWTQLSSQGWQAGDVFVAHYTGSN